jgi:hypothetical protein
MAWRGTATAASFGHAKEWEPQRAVRGVPGGIWCGLALLAGPDPYRGRQAARSRQATPEISCEVQAVMFSTAVRAARRLGRPRTPVWSERADFLGLRALAALAGGELDPLVLFESPETLHLDGGVVDENVSCAVVGGNKAITLVSVEPLYGSLRHVLSLLL